MNAVEQNAFTRSLAGMRELFPNPKAVLCISAHWMTEGSWITAMDQPKTIHDFYGFPKELFDVQYPAPGDPVLAGRIAELVTDPKIQLDREMWGLDHGAWSVLRHVFPSAEIPVLQLSLHMEQPPEYHFKLGTQLRLLRDEGVLIVGSGNIVHNLRVMKWDTGVPPYDWAVEFDAWARDRLAAKDYPALISGFRESDAGSKSVPTLEHYLPLLYVIGATDDNDRLRFHFEEIHNASISMRTLSFVPT
jgi:4,5-DOPA dioxygenase extradiol